MRQLYREVEYHLSTPLLPPRFGCGNYYTLTDGGVIHETANVMKKDIEKLAEIPFHGGTSPREALLQFWTEHYHASNMKLLWCQLIF
jgi:secreted Zn-dependent insulinase-like peptidase